MTDKNVYEFLVFEDTTSQETNVFKNTEIYA